MACTELRAEGAAPAAEPELQPPLPPPETAPLELVDGVRQEEPPVAPAPAAVPELQPPLPPPETAPLEVVATLCRPAKKPSHRARVNTPVKQDEKTGPKTPIEQRVHWGKRYNEAGTIVAKRAVMKQAKRETGKNDASIRSWARLQGMNTARMKQMQLEGTEYVKERGKNSSRKARVWRSAAWRLRQLQLPSLTRKFETWIWDCCERRQHVEPHEAYDKLKAMAKEV